MDLIGRTWNSERGVRRVERVEDFPGLGLRAFISTEGERHQELLSPDQIARQIQIDESRAAHARRAADARASEEVTSRAAVAREATSPFGRFLAALSPPGAAKARAALMRQVSIRQKMTTRREFVEQAVLKERATVGLRRDGRCLIFPDEGYFREADLTKIALDYAAFLHTDRPHPTPNVSERRSRFQGG